MRTSCETGTSGDPLEAYPGMGDRHMSSSVKCPRCPHPRADISSLGASRQKQRLYSPCHIKVTCGRWTPALSGKSFQYLLCDKTAFHYVDHCSGFSLNLKHCPSTVWNACQTLREQCQEVFSCGAGGQPCAVLESAHRPIMHRIRSVHS